MEYNKVKNLIIGAGIAGIGCYLKYGYDIYEKECQGGGLCSSFYITSKKSSKKKFFFDYAVHLSFTTNNMVKNFFSKVKCNCYKPIPYSWFNNMWVQHPIQNNLYKFDIKTKCDSIKSFINKKIIKNPKNFKDYLISQYGQYLYDNFLKKYNEKYWCEDLTNLGTDWLGKRFDLPTIDKVLYGSYTKDTINTYYAKEMRYPLVKSNKNNGFFEFIKPYYNDAKSKNKIHYNYNLQSIDIKHKIVEFDNGEKILYDKIYCSIPLTKLVNCTINASKNVYNYSKKLSYTKIQIVSIGFNRKIDCDKIWFYIYDKDIYASRAYLPSNKSKYNVPRNCSSIQFEIYYRFDQPFRGKNEAIYNCIYALKKLKLASKKDIDVIDYRTIDYGNIIFTSNTRKYADKIIKYYNKNNVIPIGRFGEWRYFWSDQSFLSGYNSKL